MDEKFEHRPHHGIVEPLFEALGREGEGEDEPDAEERPSAGGSATRVVGVVVVVALLAWFLWAQAF